MNIFRCFFPSVFGILLSTFTASQAFAYYDVLDTGEVMAKGNYKITGATQVITSNGSGLNVEGSFDAGFQDEFGVRALFGLGKTEYFLGGLFKWIPIPDIEGQPAIGFNAGIIYGQESTMRAMTVRFEPLVSKKFNLQSTTWTPYASLPFGIRNENRDDGSAGTNMAAQFVLGTQLEIQKWKKLQFMAEVGADLAKAFSHVSLAAVFYFDEEKGMVLE